MAAFNLFIAISGVVFAFFVLGIHNYLTAHEENSCEMTYMFEYPQYVVSFCAGNYGCHLSLFRLYLHAPDPILLSIIKSKTVTFRKSHSQKMTQKSFRNTHSTPMEKDNTQKNCEICSSMGYRCYLYLEIAARTNKVLIGYKYTYAQSLSIVCFSSIIGLCGSSQGQRQSDTIPLQFLHRRLE
jgi:hypothetical protein